MKVTTRFGSVSEVALVPAQKRTSERPFRLLLEGATQHATSSVAPRLAADATRSAAGSHRPAPASAPQRPPSAPPSPSAAPPQLGTANRNVPPAHTSTAQGPRPTPSAPPGPRPTIATPPPTPLSVVAPTPSLAARSPAGPSGARTAAPGGSARFNRRVGEIALRFGANPMDLLAVMNHESGLNPAKINPTSNAVGLIQFMPDVAADLLGLPKPKAPTHAAVMRTPQDFADYQRALTEYNTQMRERRREAVDRVAAMSAEEQLDLVEKFLERAAGGRRLDSVRDVYMAIFWPAGIGKGPDYVVARAEGATAWERLVYAQNKGLDTNGDGVITAGDVAASVGG